MLKANKKNEIWRFLLSYIRPIKYRYWVSMLSSSTRNMINHILYAWITQIVIDRITGGKMAGFGMVLLWFCLIRVGIELYSNIFPIMHDRCCFIIERNIRDDIAKHILSMSSKTLDSKHSASYTSIIQNDLSSLLGSFYGGLGLSYIISLIFAIIGGMASVFAWGVSMGMCYFITAFISTIISWKMQNKIGIMQNKSLDAASSRQKSIIDIFSSFHESKIYDIKNPLMRRFSISQNEYTDLNYGMTRLYKLRSLSVSVIMLLGLVSALTVGLIGVYFKTTTIGSVIAALMVLNSQGWIYRELPWAISNLKEGITSGERIMDFLKTDGQEDEKQVFDTTNISEKKIDTKALIDMDHITFGYNFDPIIKDLSLKIYKGDVLAVVGPSGGGKTTLLKIIAGIYMPDGGMVYLNGRPLSMMPLDEWRSHFAYIPQQNPIFHGTIYENVTLGLKVTEKEVIDALKSAYLYDFVMSLKDGLNTVVGEGAHMLSGGEAQRIGIARAFLRNPEILIMDEPTASLDPKSEKIVLDAMGRLMEGRTTILSAHRTASTLNATRILRVENGIIKDMSA